MTAATGERFDNLVTVGLRLLPQAPPPGGRQDPRPVHRPLLPGHPAASGRQGPVRRPALRRNGSLGPGGLRRAYTLQEILTVKSDGRHRPCQDLRGHCSRATTCPGRRPESFKVLVKELQSLCLGHQGSQRRRDEIELKDDDDDEVVYTAGNHSNYNEDELSSMTARRRTWPRMRPPTPASRSRMKTMCSATCLAAWMPGTRKNKEAILFYGNL